MRRLAALLALGVGGVVAVPALGEEAAASATPAAADRGTAEAAVDPASDEASAASETPVERARVRTDFFPEPEGERVFTEKELLPYSGEPFRTARAKLDAGRPAEALAALAGKALAPPERYLQALALLRSGQNAPAAQAFAALAADYPALADRCRFSAALGWERAGDAAAAAKAYDAIGPESTLYEDGRRGLARALRASGKIREAIAALTPLAERGAPPYGWDGSGDALFLVGELLEAAREGKAAAQTYLRVWAEHPRATLANRALDRARALGARPTVEHRIARAEQMMESNASKQVVETLGPIVADPPKGLSDAWLCRARFALGKSYRKLRQHGQAIPVLEAMVEHCPKNDLWVRALYVAGTSSSIVDLERGVGFYRRIAEEMPDHPFADDALFNSAELLVRLGRPAEAKPLLETVVEKYPRGDARPEALFRLFWLARDAGEFEQGLKWLATIVHDYARAQDTSDVERARYWGARVLQQLDRGDDALRAYESLASAYPASFYALLARARLATASSERAAVLAARLAILPEVPAVIEQKVGGLARDSHFLAGIELQRLGFEEEALRELRSINRAPLREDLPADGLRLLVVLLSRLGESKYAHAVARTNLRRDLAGPPTAETALVWRAAYPLEYRDVIERSSKTAEIDPDLLQALIREESALDPRIQSWAGAVGLCQLMPGTAKMLARELKIRGRITVKRLYEPEFNVRLGAAYVAQLVHRFKGSLPLALAAYNAGPNAVSRWMDANPGRSLDELVEQIPIDETRNYVKRVLRSYAAYQLVYGRGARITQGLLAKR